jgi:multimeric flavodoxin WrbA
MKVLAINSSPRPEGQSRTFMMLSHLVKGMREAGAEVEVVDLRRKKVNLCMGCYTCWSKTPGICAHKDDMTEELFDKWLDSDIAIYATPLYHYTLNASMKAFIERTLPMLKPFLIEREESTSHPLRDRKPPQAVLLSVCGFPEMGHFDQLSAYFHKLWGRLMLAEILRPGAEALPNMDDKRREVLEATERAGHELVENRSVSPQTLEVITQDLGVSDEFRKVANLMWKTCIAEGLTPKEFDERGMVPRPDSLETYLMLMRFGFKPDAAVGIDKVIQFDFTGEEEGTCQLKIASGRMETCEGPQNEADLTITAPFDVWMDVITGKTDPQQAFMDQKCSAEGEFELLMKFGTWFGR